MPNQSTTLRFEIVNRNSSENYFAGRGGVTSPDGYLSTPLTPDWRPDLVKSETKVILVLLFRL